jgi:hypothetical protein
MITRRQGGLGGYPETVALFEDDRHRRKALAALPTLANANLAPRPWRWSSPSCC